MLKWSYLIVGFLFILSSCDNDFEIAAEWKDIPVVYGILSPQDTAHYIRIEKAFLDGSIPATEIARNPDSLYYPALDAAIVDISNDRRYQLIEVNGTTEGYVRDEGVFLEDPNVLYKVSAEDLELQGGSKYRLEINRSENLPLVTATVEQVDPPRIVRPGASQELRFTYDRDFDVVWQEPENASFYDVLLSIHYAEWLASEPENKDTLTLDWSLGRNITGNETSVLGIEFYEYLASELVEDPMIRRRYVSIDVRVTSGGKELLEFRTIQLANSGITGAGGELPTYTNLSEGLGLLTTSDVKVIPNLPLTQASRDSLTLGSITAGLNFQ